MKNENTRTGLLAAVSEAAKYCYLIDKCLETDRIEFVSKISLVLPQLYIDFLNIPEEELADNAEYEYFPTYIDEQAYESVKENLARLMGGEDTYLETFEEDMKYSDSPIAATISESLADIYQPLFNFVSVARDYGSESLGNAFKECKENFDEYWSQTLCNVLRPLNHLRLTISEEE